MPRYFVNDPPVAIADPNGSLNVIYIRPKMDMATDARVKNELIRLGADNTTVETRVGENQLALLIHNVVSWSGPDLDGAPCDAEHMKQLDPTDPHVAAVLSAIAERNRRPQSPKATTPITNTSESAGEGDSNGRVGRGRRAPVVPAAPALDNGMLPSNLLSVSDGRPNKSTD